MARVITTGLLQTLSAGFSTKYNDAYADAANSVPIFWPDLVEEVPSSSLKEIFGWMKGIPGYREWIDDRVVNQLESADYTIESKKFELTLGVPADAIRYDTLGIYNSRATWMGSKARTFRDELLWPLIKNGFTQVGPDGQYFYDTDHPLTDKTGAPITASNFISGAGSAWFLVAKPGGIKPFILTKAQELDFVARQDPTDPRVFDKDEFVWGSKGRFGTGYFLWQLIQASTQPLTGPNFDAAFSALSTRLGDKGSKMPLTPTDAYFPLSMRSDVNATLLVERLANGASNPNFKIVNVHFVPYLDWA
jgi:phage major head subunit gpT-like protein